VSHEPPAAAASPEHFLAGDGFDAIEIGADSVALLQRFFDANPDYFLAVNGEIAGVGEAHEEVQSSLPAGWPFTRKWVVGIVDSNGALVAMMNIVSDLLAAGVWHIGLFMVGVEARGTGLAPALLRRLERWAIAGGATWLRLGVVAGNARAEKFWESAGFVEVRRREGVAMGRKINSVRVMVKPLAGETLPDYLQQVARDRPEAPSPAGKPYCSDRGDAPRRDVAATGRMCRPLSSIEVMTRPDSDKVFAGSIPRLYEEYLVPLIFEPYAGDLAERVAARRPERVLEIAAGTGVVTRRLAAVLPESCAIVATDLNPGMLEQARAVGSARPLEWQTADAQQLPFDDGSFDAVVCQFGVMFFPDKGKAFAETRRVLRPGGAFVFNAWDRIEDNEFADVVIEALATVFPADPPRFLARTPHGYHDTSAIAADLAKGGFATVPEISTVTRRSRAPSPRHPAIAYCQGTPLRSEIEARDKSRLGEATDIAAEAVARRFGTGAVDGKIQAHIVSVAR